MALSGRWRRNAQRRRCWGICDGKGERWRRWACRGVVGGTTSARRRGGRAASGVPRRCQGGAGGAAVAGRRWRAAAEHEVMAEGTAYLANPDKPINTHNNQLILACIFACPPLWRDMVGVPIWSFSFYSCCCWIQVLDVSAKLYAAHLSWLVFARMSVISRAHLELMEVCHYLPKVIGYPPLLT